MFYVGINIGRETHEASIIDEQGTLQGRYIRFSSSQTNYQRFLDWLPRDLVKMAMEATGNYWLPLYDFLKGKDFEITVLNPLRTEAHRRGRVRKTKIDKQDSLIIADLLRPRAVSPRYITYEWIQQLREITRFRFGLTDTVSDLKCQILCILDNVLPEFKRFFSSPFL